MSDIALPGAPAYAAATAVFNLAAPVAPAEAVTARSVDDVRAALAHARSTGRGVRVITTGHASGSEKPMDGALLVRTELGHDVTVDVEARVARVPAGAVWKDVLAASTPHGLVPPHGSAGTVGVVGYLLRGGISFYGRKAGLAANSLRAIELVTADGELRRVDADADPELFWALRGGGGGFGVVTAVEVALFPATTVHTGTAFWPAEHAPALLAAWRAWSTDAPNAATTTFRLLNLPPLPDLPEVLTGRTMVCIDGVIVAEGDVAAGNVEVVRAQADALLAPLRAIAPPVMDTWHETTPTAVLATHMDPEEPVPAQGDHLLLGDLGEEGAAEFLRLLGAGAESPLVMAGLRQLGGALAVADPAGGALAHIAAPLLYSAAGIPMDEASAAEITAYLAKVRAALAPWDTGRTAPTFVESAGQPQRHLDDERIAAVDRVRARIDPNGLFAGDIATNATFTR